MSKFLPLRMLTDNGWENIAFEMEDFIENLERWQSDGWLEKLKERRG